MLLYFIDSNMHIFLHVNSSEIGYRIEVILVLFHDLMDNTFSFLGLYKIVAYHTSDGALELTKIHLNLIMIKIPNSHWTNIVQCLVQSHPILLALRFFVLHKLQCLKLPQISM